MKNSFNYNLLNSSVLLCPLFMIENRIFYILLSVGIAIYFIGIFGIIYNTRNVLISMLCIEISYLGIIMMFINYALVSVTFDAYVFALFCLVLAAAESAVGLAILMSVYFYNKQVDINSLRHLRG
jgi:NADH-quinone oxidoreductase subunit K